MLWMPTTGGGVTLRCRRSLRQDLRTRAAVTDTSIRIPTATKMVIIGPLVAEAAGTKVSFCLFLPSPGGGVPFDVGDGAFDGVWDSDMLFPAGAGVGVFDCMSSVDVMT